LILFVQSSTYDPRLSKKRFIAPCSNSKLTYRKCNDRLRPQCASELISKSKIKAVGKHVRVRRRRRLAKFPLDEQKRRLKQRTKSEGVLGAEAFFKVTADWKRREWPPVNQK